MPELLKVRVTIKVEFDLGFVEGLDYWIKAVQATAPKIEAIEGAKIVGLVVEAGP